MGNGAASSPVVETVSRKRVITAAELAKEGSSNTPPDFWEFIESLTPQRWADEDFRLAIVREDPKPSTYGGMNTLEQCQGVLEVRPGVSIPLDDREGIQLGIKQKYGGRAYRLILKKGRERICEGKCMNEAPPKYPEGNSTYGGNPLPSAAAAQSDANAIASKAIDTVANQPQEVMNIAINALRASAELIAKSATPPAPAAASTVENDLDRALRQAMIAKLLAPPPDPVESFLRIKAALGANDTSGNPLVNKLLEAAIDKMLNPVAPVVGGRTTLLDLGREFIPVLGSTVRETMHEYRLSREADARIVELQRGMTPAHPAQPPRVPAIDVAPQPAPPAPNPAPAAAAPAAAPALTLHQVEEHIAKIVKNVEYPVDEAVDRVLSFLYDTDERLVGLLLNPTSLDVRLAAGKQGLLQLFTYEPILQPCLVNTPRLSEFIDKFIVAATEAEAQEARLRAAAPGTASAPAPA